MSPRAPALEWRSGAGMVAYATSKAAVAALTAALAEEVVKDGILVNAVAPSTMDTQANRQRHAQSRFRALAESRRGGGDNLCFSLRPTIASRAARIVPVYGKS